MAKGTWLPSESPSKADLKKISEDALNTLNTSDRVKAESAWHTLPKFMAAGAPLGLGVGILLAIRHRRVNSKIANAFRPAEQPVSVKFANGREGMQ